MRNRNSHGRKGKRTNGNQGYPAAARTDYRLDLLRGLANWAIYLDHIPNNAVNWITQKHFGFSDAADLFVFMSGYTASFVYARTMLERGFIIAGTRLVKRAWQIYVAHVLLFVIYLAEIGYLAQHYHDPNLENKFNVAGSQSAALMPPLQY